VFTVTEEQKQYLTYILQDTNSDSKVEVVPERGGIVTRWQLQGQDILAMDWERFTHPELSVRGGIPILFPICGNLPDDAYTVNGKQYKLKQHGFARNSAWEVTEQSHGSCASLTVLLNSSEDIRAVYPFDFKVAFTYQVLGNSLTIKQSYTNLSEETMAFATGFHPYFKVEDKSQLAVDIPATEYVAKDTQEIIPFDGSFDYDREEIDAAFPGVSKDSTSFTDNQRGLKVEISYPELFSTVVFWTVKGKDFICLEPWSAPRNALNTGDKLTRLEPGSSLETWIKLTANFIE